MFAVLLVKIFSNKAELGGTLAIRSKAKKTSMRKGTRYTPCAPPRLFQRSDRDWFSFSPCLTDDQLIQSSVPSTPAYFEIPEAPHCFGLRLLASPSGLFAILVFGFEYLLRTLTFASPFVLLQILFLLSNFCLLLFFCLLILYCLNLGLIGFKLFLNKGLRF